MYQKCVCFLFLVILVVLSCSGFHIDNLAMADLSKKSFRTSTHTYSNTDEKNSYVQRPHKIRHHRLWRTQVHNRYPKPHIDMFVYPPPPHFSSKPNPTTNIFPPSPNTLGESNTGEISYSKYSNNNPILPHRGVIHPRLGEFKPPWLRADSSASSEVKFSYEGKLSEKNSSLTSPTTFPNENLAQIPPTDFAPVKFVVSRAQRSPDHKKINKRRNRWTMKQSEDIFTKAYKAKFVVLAEVESKPYKNESNGSCNYYVKVIKDFKDNAANYFGSVNKHLRKMLNTKCELVKEMTTSKKYVLMLNESFGLVDTPKPKEKLRPAMRKKISRICKHGFVPKKPHILDIKEVSPKSRRKIELRNRILICTVRGFPLPKITWRRKNQELHHSRAYNVLYKRRQSKLVIKKPDAEYLGQYECVAETVNGLKASKNFTLLPQPNKKCSENFDKDFCQNGGTCFHEASMNYYGCFCPDNYSGEKCEVKKPSNTSMYPQPDLYACNLGLSTKYNC
ncbi:uncharacterized protein vn isoform X2 [Diabrotica undecimpunctata]|uniref:uncharacterized protein vn isoform X2 n=1 Tax=Diabrotica undecimpunctata TaxID=50387 RepID=UPI003B637131